DARANQLAHHLRKLGVRPDDRVALCIDRGFAMIVGVLAVLKAGGAYVPMDPNYPPERIDYMLRDSAPKAVLTQAASAALFADAGVPVLDIAAASPAWAGESRARPDRASVGLGARNLAYVIYTSGSTGKPKGVAVEHRGLCNLVLTQGADFGIDENS